MLTVTHTHTHTQIPSPLAGIRRGLNAPSNKSSGERRDADDRTSPQDNDGWWEARCFTSILLPITTKQPDARPRVLLAATLSDVSWSLLSSSPAASSAWALHKTRHTRRTHTSEAKSGRCSRSPAHTQRTTAGNLGKGACLCDGQTLPTAFPILHHGEGEHLTPHSQKLTVCALGGGRLRKRANSLT